MLFFNDAIDPRSTTHLVNWPAKNTIVVKMAERIGVLAELKKIATPVTTVISTSVRNSACTSADVTGAPNDHRYAKNAIDRISRLTVVVINRPKYLPARNCQRSAGLDRI